MKKNKLIVLEGIDGSGTSTQIALLKDLLLNEGFRVFVSAEPTKSVIGLEIRKILARKEPSCEKEFAQLALLFAADRMAHVNEVLLPSLSQYDFVILDRYIMSSFVYQGLSQPIEWIMQINSYAIKPDLNIILDISEQEAIKRLSLRQTTKDFFEEEKMLKNLRHRYLHFANLDKESSVVLDACGEKNEILSQIYGLIAQRFM